MAPVTFALLLLFLLQLKHLFADFYLQTARMLQDRAVYAHLGRAQHAGVHIIGSFIALTLMGVGFWGTVIVCVLEWVVHFHIDWAKGVWSDRKGHGPEHPSYWRAFGVDQALHQWTYLLMVWAVLP